MKPNQFIKIIIRGDSAERLINYFEGAEIVTIADSFGADHKDVEVKIEQEYN